jgi:hypothetical protein
MEPLGLSVGDFDNVFEGDLLEEMALLVGDVD